MRALYRTQVLAPVAGCVHLVKVRAPCKSARTLQGAVAALRLHPRNRALLVGGRHVQSLPICPQGRAGVTFGAYPMAEGQDSNALTLSAGEAIINCWRRPQVVVAVASRTFVFKSQSRDSTFSGGPALPRSRLGYRPRLDSLARSFTTQMPNALGLARAEAVLKISSTSGNTVMTTSRITLDGRGQVVPSRRQKVQRKCNVE